MIDDRPDFEELWQVEYDRAQHDGRDVVFEILRRQEFRRSQLAEETNLGENK